MTSAGGDRETETERESAGKPAGKAAGTKEKGGQASVLGRPGKYAKGVARRQEILDRAIEVFRERGADGTSLRRIGEAIGVSHAALLHYFDSREELLVAVYEHAEGKRNGTAGAGLADSAVGVIVRSAMLNVEVPGLVQLYSTLVAASLEAHSQIGRDFFTGRFDRVRGDLERRLRVEQDEGRIRGDVDPGLVAALIVGASDGLQIQWLLEPDLDLQRTLETFAVLLAP
ncbi:TetR/AcrR family transcriptional regulator [Kocuria coralli]|uniref:TetR/AcrR family transcriptional regulator n=1 Tax=Kocuria coralli TaxID=1461025 RepID=A0A5J5KWG7_9MICC|nr:TetR/AcrR family transcriptional regulator [Kocuria coralli]KAA9393206.1 TetR/AcrR family transcriptional regulator [Kocuria coralli]